MGLSVIALISFILIIVALILQILGVAIPFWWQVSNNGYSTYAGLWRGCAEAGNRKICGDTWIIDWLSATQAMELIGLILIFFALVLSIITTFVKKDMKVLKLICWILCFAACMFITIGIIIYGAETDYGDIYSGAFAITIVAGILILIAGILSLLDWMGTGSSAKLNAAA